MRIRYVSGTLGMFFALYSNAQVVSAQRKFLVGKF